ncbi:hypothetical protein [Sphingomonas arenae]|uniref:hypothetical protein n=1 Tax=Sphingomonas arenae TaxID=2812555 RepID=UPI0019683CC4|nr:hypothetical protein [Sphingomonas arenae]
MSGLAAATLSIATISALVLMIAGARFAWGREHRKQGVLMIAAGFVILVNVLIWAVPGPGSLAG